MNNQTLETNGRRRRSRKQRMKLKQAMQARRNNIEKERYLCFGTYYSFHCIDLKEGMQNPGREEKLYGLPEELPPPASFVTRLNLVQDDSNDRPLLPPVGTSFLSRLPKHDHTDDESSSPFGFLMGGQNLKYTVDKSGSKEEKSLGCSFDYYAVCPIVETKPSSSTSSSSSRSDDYAEVKTLSFTKLPDKSCPPRMVAGKCYPIVEEIDGKLYVLHTCYVLNDDLSLPPRPAFEVFDPETGLWEALDDPPFYPEDEHRRREDDHLCTITGHVVIGDKLFVQCMISLEAYYDTKARKWTVGQWKLWPDLSSSAKCVPHFFGKDKDIHLLTQVDGMHGCSLALLNSDGQLFATQDIYDQLFGSLSFDCVFAKTYAGYFPSKTAVLISLDNSSDISKTRMCAVALVFVPGGNIIVSVVFFSISKRAAAESKVMRYYNLSRYDPDHVQYLKDTIEFADIQVERTYIRTLGYFDEPDPHQVYGPAFFL